MTQVIEVRFLNPSTGEVIDDHFTQANSHSHAIDLALWNWSDGQAILKGIERVEEGIWMPRGANSCWKYVYHITLEDEDGVGERHMLAILFATYKEKKEERTSL